MSAYDLHGAALLDCFRGETSAMLICHQDGGRDDVPAAFWLRETIDPLEALALDLCCGRVLDVGAGAGLHALELQRRGIEVTAIDIAPECVMIMRERGVRSAELADLYEFGGGGFDTIICLCNGLDKVGRLADLPRFLGRIRELLAPGGQLIADSFDLRVGADAARLAELARKETTGRYFGETDTRAAAGLRSRSSRSTTKPWRKLQNAMAGGANWWMARAAIISFALDRHDSCRQAIGLMPIPREHGSGGDCGSGLNSIPDGDGGRFAMPVPLRADFVVTQGESRGVDDLDQEKLGVLISPR